MARPKSDSREKIVDSARTLLRRQGYQGTGLAQIIAGSGAPRGSTYFLFPGGKEQIAAEAVRSSGREFTELIREARTTSSTAEEWIKVMIDSFGRSLEVSGFREGCPVSTVTLDSVPGSASLTASVRDAYDGWLAALREGLASYRVPDPEGVAVLVLASVEGALLLCRAYSSLEPLTTVRDRILAVMGT